MLSAPHTDVEKKSRMLFAGAGAPYVIIFLRTALLHSGALGKKKLQGEARAYHLLSVQISFNTQLFVIICVYFYSICEVGNTFEDVKDILAKHFLVLFLFFTKKYCGSMIA